MNRVSKWLVIAIVASGIAVGGWDLLAPLAAAQPGHPPAIALVPRPEPDQTLPHLLAPICTEDPPHLTGGMLEWALANGVKDGRHYWYYRRGLAARDWIHYECPGID